MVDKLRRASKLEDFVSKFNESSRAFLAKRCVNNRNGYLMILQYGEGHRKGVVMVPKSVNSVDWHWFRECFRQLSIHLLLEIRPNVKQWMKEINNG